MSLWTILLFALSHGLEQRHESTSASIHQLHAAGCREGKDLAEEDAKQEGRLTAHLFRLLRCGRLHTASQLACQVSQPWRATSMAGGGLYGPLPLGQAAWDAAASDVDEAVAGEDENGCGASRALWKWACYQARYLCCHLRLPAALQCSSRSPAQPPASFNTTDRL